MDFHHTKGKAKKLNIVEGQLERIEPDIGTFPLEFSKQVFSPDTYELIDWHWHTGVQFCYVTRGSFQFKVVRDEIHLAEGEGIFINAKQVHTAYPKQIYGEYLCLNLSPYLFGLEGSALFQQYMAPILFQTSVSYQLLRRSDSHTHKALQLLAQCSHEAERAEGTYDLSLLAHLLLLWNELLKNFPISPKQGNWQASSLHNSRMQEILTYLQTHYTQKITLQEVADAVHLSRSECSRFFHTVSGQSLFQYLTELRINRSIELLAHTNKSITEIAYETGFSSQSYFTQRFRLYKGISPEQFRKTLFTKE